jgi:hypothetical protein
MAVSKVYDPWKPNNMETAFLFFIIIFLEKLLTQVRAQMKLNYTYSKAWRGT